MWSQLIGLGILVTVVQVCQADLGDDFLAATPLHPVLRIPDIPIIDEDNLKIDFITNFTGTFIPFEDCSFNKTDLKIGDHGTITTPNYPRNYPGRTACQWYLESPNNTKIEATIFDLYTQPWFFTYFDYVMISKDGNFSNVDRMAGDMNTKTPLTLVSESNKLGIRFRSSTLFNFRGMKIQYLVKPANGSVEKLAPSPFDDTCGKSNLLETQKHIIGPGIAEKGSFSWMAALLIDGRSFCGGSLIDDQHVLTAAHCTDGAKRITVLLGSLNIKAKKEDEPDRIVFNVTKENIFQHPSYNPNTISHDITVIKLPEKVTFNNNVRPICFPNTFYESKTFVGEEVRVSGWGKPFDKASGISPDLKNTTISVMSNGQCRSFFRSIVTGNLICVATKLNASPCRGDSGGPLVIKQVTEAGQPFFMQVGIVSFGGSRCQRGYPVGFTRVTAFLDYIQSVRENSM